MDAEQPYRWIPEDDSLLGPQAEFAEVESTTGDDPDASAHPHEADDADVYHRGVFKREIQRDPEICSSCFTKNYDVIYPFTHKTSGPDGKVRYFIPAGGNSESCPHAGRETQNPPRACHCGRIGPLRHRPLSKPLALEAAWNLSETLVAKGIEHNPLILVATVLERKRTPSHATTDDSNFDTAVGRSLPTYDYDLADYLHPLRRAPPALPSGDE